MIGKSSELSFGALHGLGWFRRWDGKLKMAGRIKYQSIYPAVTEKQDILDTETEQIILPGTFNTVLHVCAPLCGQQPGDRGLDM